MKIKLPEILAALFLCLCEINPQISVYGLSERNYYNDVLYRQKHGSNLDTLNTPRYQITSITSRNALDPSDSNIDHTTHSEAYLHDQRNSTDTKFRKYRTLTNSKVNLRGRRYQDKCSDKNEPSFKAIIGYEKQCLNLEINGVSPANSTGEQCRTTAELEMVPAALVYRRSTVHQTDRWITTEKISNPTHHHHARRTTRRNSSYSDVIAAARRLESTSTVVPRVQTISGRLHTKAEQPAVAARLQVALGPSKENIVLSANPLDAIAFATIRSMMKKFKRMRGNGNMDDAVSNQTAHHNDTQLRSNFTPDNNQEDSDQHEITVSTTSCSTAESTSQENSTEITDDQTGNSEFSDTTQYTTEQYHEEVNGTSPE